MTIIEQDIERYTGYKEFVEDGLYRCHHNDEKRMKHLISAYDKLLEAMEELKLVSQCRSIDYDKREVA